MEQTEEVKTDIANLISDIASGHDFDYAVFHIKSASLSDIFAEMVEDQPEILTLLCNLAATYERLDSIAKVIAKLFPGRTFDMLGNLTEKGLNNGVYEEIQSRLATILNGGKLPSQDTES